MSRQTNRPAPCARRDNGQSATGQSLPARSAALATATWKAGLLTVAAALAAGAVALSAPSLASAESPFSATEKGAIEDIVRDYLLENPEILVEAIEVLQSRQDQAASDAARDTLMARAGELFDNPNTPVAGNPEGDVTLVEFFDYQCGYCKVVHNAVQDLIADDGNIRFVMKEFPVLGPESVLASRAALAAHRQDEDLYVDFHNALMEHRGSFDHDLVMRLARSVGLDTDRLERDMDDPEITSALEHNRELATALNIRGTPAFIIGDQIVPGAVERERLETLVSRAREG